MTTVLETPRWIVGARDRAAEATLQRELGIPSLVAAVLVQRGLGDPQAAHHFLHPSLDDLHAPETLPDYVAARDAILLAKDRQDLIYIHGDYDVDGVTSAAILYRFLSAIKCRVHVHVPHRMKEGYGIHLSAVEEAKAMGAKLFLTCDCGISALDQIAAKLSALIAEHGPRSVAVYHGTGAYRSVLGAQLEKSFLSAIGSPNLFSTMTIDQSAKWVTSGRMGIMASGKPAFADVDLAVIVGKNPVVAHQTGTWLRTSTRCSGSTRTA